MKKNIKTYLVIFLALALSVTIAFAVISGSGAAVLNVNEVAPDPAAFTGVITITGIVAGVSQQDPTIIGMMDKKELQCTSTNCNKIYLPFKAANYSAVRGDEVRITGQFVASMNAYLFMAEKVRVVKNHNIGG